MRDGGTVGPLGTPGSFGAVYLARSAALGHLVAIKIVEAHRPLVPNLVRREAAAQAALNHTNLVRVYDLVVVEGRLAIVMEYAAGGSLEGVRDRAVSANARWRLLVEAARGLGAMHERGLIHRDVKPANILVSADGIAKVADLGVVTASSAADDPLAQVFLGRASGTERYASPEQHRGDWLTPATDVYSLAVTAHEVLTGTVARRAQDVHQLGPTGLGRQIDAALAACVRADPGERPTDGGALAELLEDVGDHHLPSWMVGRLPPVSVSATRSASSGVERPAEGTTDVPPDHRVDVDGTTEVPDGPPPVEVEVDVEVKGKGEVEIAAETEPDDPDRTVLRPAAAAVPPPGRPAAPPRPVLDEPVLPVAPPRAPDLDRYRQHRSRRWRTLAIVVLSLSSGVLVGAVVVAVQRLRGDDPPAVLGVEAVADLESTAGVQACPLSSVRVRAVVRTNGGAGTLRLRWAVSDGREVTVEVPVVARQREVRPELDVPLAAAERGLSVRLTAAGETALESPAHPIASPCP